MSDDKLYEDFKQLVAETSKEVLELSVFERMHELQERMEEATVRLTGQVGALSASLADVEKLPENVFNQTADTVRGELRQEMEALRMEAVRLEKLLSEMGTVSQALEKRISQLATRDTVEREVLRLNEKLNVFQEAQAQLIVSQQETAALREAELDKRLLQKQQSDEKRWSELDRRQEQFGRLMEQSKTEFKNGWSEHGMVMSERFASVSSMQVAMLILLIINLVVVVVNLFV
ncbi:hypothetical protein ACI48J_07410 [Paenibacillus chitinolyticus]|uniref:hypothetical protein n=1 Tax=Paenibacillus chitinolyticus TaxID=79263 RepID=UPI0038632495